MSKLTEMAVNLISYEYAEDEYIDMEVSAFSSLLYNSPREFEFQMSTAHLEREPTTSPADELFYKGKLLPLQMVNKLLQNPDSAFKSAFDQELYSTPLATTAAPTPTASTPFESCTASPSVSCQVSCELNPEDYFLHYSTQLIPKKSWTRKLNVIKKSSLGSKLKASLRSLFGKSGCSDESCAADAKNVKASNKNTYQRSSGDGARHRRSFSLSIGRNSTNKSSPSSSDSSSSSCSNNSSGVHNLNRSSSIKSEMESPIQGAIAHCKQSQQIRKTLSEVGFYSLSAARVSVCDDQQLSRG